MRSWTASFIVLIAAGLLVWTTLLANKVQRLCVDVGAINQGELRKVALSVAEAKVTQGDLKSRMIDCHASAGGMLMLSGVAFVILSGTIILVESSVL